MTTQRLKTAARLLAAASLVIPLLGRAETPPAGGAHAHDAEQLYTCGMHPQVIRDQPGQCPICGMQLTPLRAAPSGDAAKRERKILYYWDPMLSPPYISDKPGKSPMGMDLLPVYEDEVSAGAAVVIDPTIMQNMGVRLATVGEGPLRRSIRAVGYLDEAQPNQRDINLRVSGWIQRLYADVEGMHVRQGTPLFDLYSPELQVAIGELIAARAALPADAAPDGAPMRIYEAARQKLELLGLARAEVERLAQLERPPATVTFTSPITGHVVEKPIVAGDAVQAGTRALRIVDHSSLWLDVRIFEPQLPFVRLGQPIRATAAAFPGRAFSGTISFIHPHLDPMTRTATARLVVENPSLELRPGMYATAELEAELAPRALLAPRDAVIDTGSEQMVFVARPNGHFDPRRVSVGTAADGDMVQILAGLTPGEQVVTSGQFLLDAESNFRQAIQRFLSTREAVSPPNPPGDAEGNRPPSERPPEAHVH